MRRKYDKFVHPQGELPQPHQRPETQEIEPRLPRVDIIMEEESESDQEILIADSHHEGPKDELVLYKQTELYGEFNFRDTILQQLERYFVYVKRMKKHSPDDYEFYRQVGAHVLPYSATGADRRQSKEDKKDTRPIVLSAWFHQHRPSFGCFVYGADLETEKYELAETKKHSDKGMILYVPKFMSYTKYAKAPPEIQPMSGGDTYKMTVWWDRPHDPKSKMKYGSPQEFGIFISRDGKQIAALRMLDTKWIPIREKHKNHIFHIPQRAWHLPSDYEEWAKLHHENAQEFLARLFCDSVAHQEHAHYSMIRVAATKGDITAVFGVNIRRLAYFFQDRDIELNESGKRKQVFHMVRAYVRQDGTAVRFHFRGTRQFTWAGYDVLITVPGRDHLMLNEIDIGATDEYWIDEKEQKKFLRWPEVGKKLADAVKRGRN
jgi:hypothetical protein